MDWVSVKDRYPEPETIVLTLDKYKNIEFLMIDNDVFTNRWFNEDSTKCMSINSAKITHWCYVTYPEGANND